MRVRESFELLLKKMEAAAQRQGRKASDIQLIAVTKNASFQQMQQAYDLSIRSFGENRLQKALPKMSFFPKDIQWHFIGPIQSNKVSEIACNFHVIHSISSLKIAGLFSKEGMKNQKKIPCFLQINIAKEEQKQGFTLDEFFSLQEDLLSLEGLEIRGLMTMAPHTHDLAQIRHSFRSLRELASKWSGRYPFLSMGMSGDFEIAIEEGATHIRIGSDLFS